jgi:hypothetical protein
MPESNIGRPLGPFVLNAASEQALGLVSWWPLGFQNGNEIDWFGRREIKHGTAAPTTGVDPFMGPSRKFVSASSQYLEGAYAPVLVEPCSLYCWANPASLATSMCCLTVAKAAGVTTGFQLSTAATSAFRAQTIDSGGGGSVATSTLTYVANNWYQVVGVFASATDRRALTNGGYKGTEATSRSVGTVDTTDIGSRYSAGVNGLFWNGMLADCRIYKRVLRDAEIAKWYEPAFRWELMYQLGKKRFSFPPAAAVVASTKIGASVMRIPHRGQGVLCG